MAFPVNPITFEWGADWKTVSGSKHVPSCTISGRPIKGRTLQIPPSQTCHTESTSGTMKCVFSEAAKARSGLNLLRTLVFRACQKTSVTFLSCLWPLKSKYTVGIYTQGKWCTMLLMGMFSLAVEWFIKWESRWRSNTIRHHLWQDIEEQTHRKLPSFDLERKPGNEFFWH